MLVAVAATLILTLGVGARALAEPSLGQYKPTRPDALAHFEAGNRAYKNARNTSRPLADRVRDLRRAIDEYIAGQVLEPDAAAFDYNIAHAARLLVDNTNAIVHLQQFLERARPDEQLRLKVENEISELDPSGEIRVNLRQAKAPSGESKSPAVASATVSTPSAAPGGSRPVAAAPAVGLTPEPRESHAWVRLGWGLTAVALIGGGATTWLTVSANGLDSDAKVMSRTSADRIDLQNQADSHRHAALIVGIGSGAALVLGIVTLVLPARADARATSTAWNLGITGNGMAVFGRF
jgi:hypothetical protein